MGICGFCLYCFRSKGIVEYNTNLYYFSSFSLRPIALALY